MLCNRPNEVVLPQANRLEFSQSFLILFREFITTHFYPKDKIGLNPIMKRLPARMPERLTNLNI